MPNVITSNFIRLSRSCAPNGGKGHCRLLMIYPARY